MTNRLMNLLGSVQFRYFSSRCKFKPVFTEAWIRIGQGAKVFAHIHRPEKEGKYPGIVFVPGGLSPGTDYDRGSAVTADDVASLGFVVLHYDPSGRGKTEGKEDYWGRWHQQELANVLEEFTMAPGVLSDNIGLLSFSIGIAISAGALANFSLPFVRYLYDWEGPSNRFNITKNDTHKPLLAFPYADIAFWKEREPVSNIGNIECGYFRYQSIKDHMQGANKSHAIELVNRAALGKALWTRVNDNPPDLIYNEDKISEYKWIPSRRNHKGEILKFLNNIQTVYMHV